MVITGASSGIGEAMAKVYASMGAKVVLGARHADKLEALCRCEVLFGAEREEQAHG